MAIRVKHELRQAIIDWQEASPSLTLNVLTTTYDDVTNEVIQEQQQTQTFAGQQVANRAAQVLADIKAAFLARFGRPIVEHITLS